MTSRHAATVKRKAAVARFRDMVKSANHDGGRTLLIPARINSRGRADRYLTGLDFAWGEGFAQTPLFAKWVEQEIRSGVAKLASDACAQVQGNGQTASARERHSAAMSH